MALYQTLEPLMVHVSELMYLKPYLRKATEDSPCNSRKNSYPLSMTTDIFGTLEIRGMEIPIVGEAEMVYEDDSFDHEFGTEHCGHWEIEDIIDIDIDGNLRRELVWNQHAIGYTNHNRRFKKNLRRLEKLVISALNDLDYEAFTDREIERAIESTDRDCARDCDDRYEDR